MQQTTGKTALITGGARRVGRAIALRLAEAGFDIVLTYHRSEADSLTTCQQIRAMGRRATALAADLTQLPHSAQKIIERLDRVDVVVHNASIYERDCPEQTLDQSRRMMAVHLQAPLLLTRALGPTLRQSRGHVITMLDILAERPWPQYANYCASKAALLNLTLSLARQLAPEVTVNGISPGVVQWPDDFSEEARKAYLERVPLGRAGNAQDVATLVHFLVTQGTYITGQIIRVDGGRSLM